MPSRSLNLALIQMWVDGGAKEKNLARAGRLIEEASRNGADLVLLPECLDLGWTHPSCVSDAEPIPGGEPFRRLSEAASSNNVYLCGGLTERAGERLYNAAVFMDREGRMLHLHRKIHELDVGQECYATGERLGVVDTDLGRFGVMICADAFVEGEVISRALCRMGAKAILSPGAWAVPADHDQEAEPYGDVWRKAYVPVAEQFGVWIAGVSNVGPMSAGPWAGRKCIGSSMVIGPDGSEVVQGPYGMEAETILYVRMGDSGVADAPAV